MTTSFKRFIHPISLDLLSSPTSKELAPDYFVIWENGNLGIAFTKRNDISVAAITGKGFPHGIEHVQSSDILLSVNGFSTRYLSLNAAIRILRSCQLPATLHFARADAINMVVSRNTFIEAKTRPIRMTFIPPYQAETGITSPRNSKGPSSSPLVLKPAAKWLDPTFEQRPRYSSPF